VAPHKRRPRCAICGEDDPDLKLHRLVVVADGKLKVRRRLCTGCLAIILVSIDNTVGRKRQG